MSDEGPHEAALVSLLAAVERAPDDIALRLLLTRLLIDSDRISEAVSHCARVLEQSPGDAQAKDLMALALGKPVGADDSSPAQRPTHADTARDSISDPRPSEQEGFWRHAESQLADAIPPMFVDQPAGESVAPAWDVERPSVTLADVGGLEHVKARLNAAFLAPLRNPGLRRLYAKSLRGGLLIYGPPGCGKTFIARAVAGELGAKFIAVGIADILDIHVGTSEVNLHDIFQLARRSAPCVLFLDELDALGPKRSLTRNINLRTTVNQLLTELDGVADDNDGVFVLGATNQPWDIDAALRRPGRLDRTLLVLPPDDQARRAIFVHHLRGRPIAGIDLARCAAATDGFSGADIAYACEGAAELALIDSVNSGNPRLIAQADLDESIREIIPSVTPWLLSARTVVEYGTDDGTFKDLRAYLKRRRLL